MLKRIKNIWKLSSNDITVVRPGELIPPGSSSVKLVQVEGDGKAEFLGEGSGEEFEEQTKKDKGLWNLWPRK